jgi:hypothetical protein
MTNPIPHSNLWMTPADMDHLTQTAKRVWHQRRTTHGLVWCHVGLESGSHVTRTLIGKGNSMKINISDFVTNKDKSISGQVMEITGNRAVIIDDASEYEYPENCIEFKLSDLEPM